MTNKKIRTDKDSKNALLDVIKDEIRGIFNGIDAHQKTDDLAQRISARIVKEARRQILNQTPKHKKMLPDDVKARLYEELVAGILAVFEFIECCTQKDDVVGALDYCEITVRPRPPGTTTEQVNSFFKRTRETAQKILPAASATGRSLKQTMEELKMAKKTVTAPAAKTTKKSTAKK